MRNCIITLCVAVWVLSFVVDIAPLGFAIGTPLVTRLLYMVAHRSAFHIAINLFAFHILTKSNNNISLIVAIVASFLATFGAEQLTPTIGLSGVCYALLGTIIVNNIRNSKLWLSLAPIVIINIVSAIWGNSNVFLHAMAFVYAFVLQIIIKHLDKWKKNATNALKSK